MSFHWSSPSPEILIVAETSPRYRVVRDDDPERRTLYAGDDLAAAWRVFLLGRAAR